ncbi:DUF2061 domain-containing protein [Acidovorax sp. Leaf160]|uniref:DUF2061 domain-containing protein n=1 Tax=Acidovorax sp. Leaf160 TaxID=1736280 RepID=UPI0009EAB0A5|nr:DUF2061 domain-containing protein [Acidovorax sp. Leaf160]
MSRLRTATLQNLPTLMKTGSYYLIHICVAALVAYAVTGNLVASLTLSLLEPTVQAVAYFFHEKAWARAAERRNGGVRHRLAPCPPEPEVRPCPSAIG